jgi:hypothetical protein
MANKQDLREPEDLAEFRMSSFRIMSNSLLRRLTRKPELCVG